MSSQCRGNLQKRKEENPAGPGWWEELGAEPVTEARVASRARAPRPAGRASGPSVKQRHHLLSQPGKLRLTGYGNLHDFTELSWGLQSSLFASLSPSFLMP